jgi:hypothetical protein
MSGALLEAIQTRNVDRVAALLAAGAEPNEPGKSRYRSGGNRLPLHAAISELRAFEAIDPYPPKPAGPIDSVVLLLRYGAKVTDWDMSREMGPLWDAVMMNHVEAVRLLLAAGAEPNLRDNEGVSPLRFCAQNGLLEMARLLLHCGADKIIHESGGPAGMYALGLAVTRFHVEMVRLLLVHGADPNVADDDWMTVFDQLRLMDPPEDPAAQERLREIRGLLGDPPA